MRRDEHIIRVVLNHILGVRKGKNYAKYRAYTEAADIIAPYLRMSVEEKRCPICGRRFGKRSSLLVHIYNAEIGDLIQIAKLIVGAVDNAKRFVAQALSRGRIIGYRCEICGFKSSTETDAVLHILREHADEVVPEELKATLYTQSDTSEFEDASLF